MNRKLFHSYHSLEGSEKYILASADITEFKIKYEPESDKDYIIAEPQPLGNGTTEIEIKVGPDFSTYLEQDRPPSPILRFYADFKCAGALIQIIFSVPVIDENNQPPVWSISDLQYTLPSVWPVDIPVNWNKPLETSDKDYLENNAQIEFRLDSQFETIIKVRSTPKWEGGIPPSYDYEVSILLLKPNDLVPGIEHIITIVASDTLNEKNFELKLTIDPSGQPKFPQFSYEYVVDSLPVSIGEIDLIVQADAPSGSIVEYLVDPNVDYLIYNTGTFKFSFDRDVTLEDLENEKFPMATIKATVKGSGGVDFEDEAVFYLRFSELGIPGFECISKAVFYDGYNNC